jgi:signal peptidase I
LWAETLVLLAIALLIAIGLKAFLVQSFYIPSESMEPGFVKNDRIIVQKVSYWGSGQPERGDIVVFQDPDHWLIGQESSPGVIARGLQYVGLYPTGGHLVKRVIGVAGDHVVCCDEAGKITVNGKALDESSYLPAGTVPSQTPFDVTVPDGMLWVMGDNRMHSGDSRAHVTGATRGFVPVRLVVGKVAALVWPFGRATLIHRPDAFARLD